MAEVDSPRKRILVVDDEPNVRESLQLLLKTNFDVTTAENGERALEIVEEGAPDLILLDVLMPKRDGLDTLRALRERQIKVPVIMLTATSTVRTAVEAMKFGASDYLNKPFDVESLTSLIVNTLDADLGQRPSARGRGAASQPAGDCGPLVGKCPAMTDVFQSITQIAAKDATVLITGESGTGKELIARRLHDLSARKDGPFVAINCAAIPETLIESELFGHEKGAFTHAVEKRLGHFELADGGTLFLDEIGELSLPVQVKMLRFLQEQEFYRVGRSKPIRVNVRIITATNKNLEDLIREKRFRQDLFYRINVINLKIPPLRDRYEDIPGLVEHFIKKFEAAYGGKKLSFSEEAMRLMVEYDWPGNVRELENVVESIFVLTQQEAIGVEDLPRKLKHKSDEVMSLRPSAAAAGEVKFEEAERQFETEMILKALRKTNFVQTRAAELLGISRRILKYKMDKLGISEMPEAARRD